MRPVFCRNFEYDTRHYELECLFSRYGPLERIDMKSGYAFVYFEDERDAEDAIRSLDNIPFGYSRRRLSVEWSRQGDRGGPRRFAANIKPTKTLFVINFDPIRTRVRDIERHFEPYGNILHVRIRRNFAFVQFETQEEATEALECTNMTKILDWVVSVEYALRDDDEHDNDGYDSPQRRCYGRHGSPDYGHRSSPYYGHHPSPVYGRLSSPIYGHAHSPVYDRYSRPMDNRDRSQDYGRDRSRSPIGRSRT